MEVRSTVDSHTRYTCGDVTEFLSLLSRVRSLGCCTSSFSARPLSFALCSSLFYAYGFSRARRSNVLLVHRSSRRPSRSHDLDDAGAAR